MEAVKPWEEQPSGTLRRIGRGMQGQSIKELERPSSVRAREHRTPSPPVDVGLEAQDHRSPAERESERGIVPPVLP